MRLHLASVSVRKDDGKYVRTVVWDDSFNAWGSLPGLNQYERLESLDARTPASVAYFIAGILAGDPIGLLEFLWEDE